MRLQEQLDELTAKVAEEAKLREALHQAVAEGDPAAMFTAIADASKFYK